MGSTDSTRTAIILSACGTTSGLLAAYTPRTRQMVRLLEAECFSRNIRLIQVYTSVSGHDLDIPRYCDRVRRELSSNKTVIGIMALRIGFTETGFADLLDRYAKMNVPVAVLDDGEHPAAMPAYRPAWEKAPLAVFSLAVGPACTRLVVDHLFALGHRSFAYLSPFHTEQWSRDRLEGIGAQCGRLGRGARVKPFTEAVPFVNAEWREILKEAAGCGPAYADQVEFYEYTLVAALRNRRFVEPVLRLAGEALRSAAATAWIGANDFSAVVATSALDSAASSRARHISVAGFDDSDEAFLHGITSHNFNVQGMVNAALRHVLNPRLRPSRGKPARQVTIDGYLAVRSSTGRP